MSSDSGERLLISLCLVASNLTVMFRAPVAVVSGVMLVYLLWFVMINDGGHKPVEIVYAMLSIMMGAATTEFAAVVLNLTYFVPSTHLALAKRLDGPMHHAIYWQIFVLAFGAIGLAVGWACWNWTWAFFIIFVLYAVLVGVSFVLLIGVMRPDIARLHIVWLGIIGWHVLIFGAAQQINSDVWPMIWVAGLMATLALTMMFVNAATGIFFPPDGHSHPKSGRIVDTERSVYDEVAQSDTESNDNEASTDDDIDNILRPSMVARVWAYLRGKPAFDPYAEVSDVERLQYRITRARLVENERLEAEAAQRRAADEMRTNSSASIPLVTYWTSANAAAASSSNNPVLYPSNYRPDVASPLHMALASQQTRADNTPGF